MKLTKKALQAAVRQVRELGGGLSYDQDHEEFTVRFGEASYYTPALDDALGTAKHMAQERERQKGKSK